MTYEYLFLKSLAITILIEASVLILLFRLVFKSEKTEIWRLLITGFLASFATLPYLWFIFPNYFAQSSWYMIFSESFAVLAESVIIMVMLRIGYWRALLTSFVCNLVSFSIGLLLPWT